MFIVLAVEPSFLGKRAKLQKLDRASQDRRVTVLTSDAGQWIDGLQAPVSVGETVIVKVPAFVRLEVGQTISSAHS